MLRKKKKKIFPLAWRMYSMLTNKWFLFQEGCGFYDIGSEKSFHPSFGAHPLGSALARCARETPAEPLPPRPQDAGQRGPRDAALRVTASSTRVKGSAGCIQSFPFSFSISTARGKRGDFWRSCHLDQPRYLGKYGTNDCVTTHFLLLGKITLNRNNISLSRDTKNNLFRLQSMTPFKFSRGWAKETDHRKRRLVSERVARKQQQKHKKRKSVRAVSYLSTVGKHLFIFYFVS